MTTQNNEFIGLEIGETVFGYHGNDTIFGNGGDDLIFGGEQHDLLSGDAGNDTLLGAAGDDPLIGGDGNDSLLGGDGIDDLRGGAGADTLNGGAGNDQIAGGIGDDHMWGELGRDTFLFTPTSWGMDRIFDFEDRVDRIAMSDLPGGPGLHAMSDLLIFDRNGASDRDSHSACRRRSRRDRAGRNPSPADQSPRLPVPLKPLDCGFIDFSSPAVISWPDDGVRISDRPAKSGRCD